jgi:hypothetical protein
VAETTRAKTSSPRRIIRDDHADASYSSPPTIAAKLWYKPNGSAYT